MSASLFARGVTVVRGARVILDEVDVSVVPGRRTGLVGPNGVGKSTLLGVLAGEVAPDSRLGDRRSADGERRPCWCRSPSAARRDRARAVAPPCRRDRPRRRDSTPRRTPSPPSEPGADDRYSTSRSNAGWRSAPPTSTPGSARCGTRSVWPSGCSASRRRRCRAARRHVLRSPRCCSAASTCTCSTSPPTTSTSTASNCSRRGCSNSARGMMLVSHDRRFLDRVVTHVVELDEFTHRTAEYAGGWQAYVDERALARQHAWERFDDYDTKRKALAGRAQRQREWASQGLARVKRSIDERTRQEHPRASARTRPKQLAGKAAQTRAGDRTPGGGRQAARAVAAAPRGRRRRAQRPDRRPPQRRHRRTRRIPARSDRPVARVRRAGGDRRPQREWQVDVDRSDPRSPRTGRRATATLGAAVRIGEVEQARHQLPTTPWLQRAVQDATGLTVSEVRTLLAKFGLVGDHVQRPVGSLSPGERTRAVARLVDGQRRQPARARRTDEPPRPAGDRAARAGARHVRRHASCSSPTTGSCSNGSGSRARSGSITAPWHDVVEREPPVHSVAGGRRRCDS